MSSNSHLICIEGNIASGKTTLLEMLYSRLSINSEINRIYEMIPDERILDKFYRNEKVNNFFIEVAYLEERFSQLIKEFDSQKINICDYSFYRSQIMSLINLDKDELKLFTKLFNILNDIVPRPSLMIYINSTNEKISSNLQKRNRHFEKEINMSYIENLSLLYKDFFNSYTHSGLLIINTNDSDFVTDPDSQAKLLDTIELFIYGRKRILIYDL